MLVRPPPILSARPTGLPAVQPVRWGTHLCQLYRTAEDLLESLVGYFRAGLLAHERCVWVTSPQLHPDEARRALAAAVPDLARREASGQMTILDHTQVYEGHGFDGPKVLEEWLAFEREARAAGYAGLRLSGDTLWLERERWDDFAAYEAAVHTALHDRHILALCTYSLEQCSIDDLLEVLRSHHLALVRLDGSWRAIHGATELLAALDAMEPEAQETPLSRHGVRFFEAQAFPADAVADFLAEGLLADEGAMAILTRPHREAVVEALARHGVIAGEAVAAGRLVLHDAEALLAELTAAGLDAQALRESPATADLERLTSDGPVRLHGEMVDLLCKRGDAEGAVRLERLWNQLVDRRPVRILCTYAIDDLPRAADTMATLVEVHDAVHAEPAPHVGAAHRLELERARLHRAERNARERAQVLYDKLARLQRVTAELSEALTIHRIADVVVREMADAAGADRGVLVVPSADGRQLSVVARLGSPHDALAAPDRIPAEAPLPVAEAFRTAEGIWHPTPARLARAYPHLPDGPQALLALPLALGGRRLGAVAFGFPRPFELGSTFRAFLHDVARQATLALERARLYEEARRSRDRLQLLADAAARISTAGLDLDEVLTAFVREVTRTFAIGCIVLLGDETSLRVAALHVCDPVVEASIRRALEAAPVVPTDPLVSSVLATGRSARAEVTPELVAALRLPHRRHAEAHPIGSGLLVPLRSRGRIIGVVVATRPVGWPAFGADDQDLLQELADRAALTIDNAALHQRAQAERARAEEASRAKDQFLAMLGHELRNPLSPIVTALELMRLRGEASFVEERAVMERQVRHLSRLVDDLLDVSRITGGKLTLRRAPVELGTVVRDALEITGPLMEQRAHRLELDVPRGLVIDGDRHRLTQVLVNLLTNAAKYTPDGGHVALRAAVRDGRIGLTVADDGIGIPPELLPNIFDSFVQDEQPIERTQGGLGLGLAIVRAIVELHGGTVRATSPGPGLGSRFTVELPLHRGGQTHEPVPIRRAGSPRRLLVVDDNRDAADAMCDVLRAMGHTAHAAYDGPGALRSLDTRRPDLALLDLTLPGMDGFELAQAIRQRCGADRGPEVRLVAMSGYWQDLDHARTRAAGFEEHLVKPVDLDTLADLLGRLPAGRSRVEP